MNQQQTQPTCRTGQASTLGHIGKRRLLSPLLNPCSPKNVTWTTAQFPFRSPWETFDDDDDDDDGNDKSNQLAHYDLFLKQLK